MNYIGSKLSLLNFIEKSIKQVVGEDNNRVFCDLFAGTGTVGLHFKKMGYKIISNDIQYYSYVLNKHYIANHKVLEFNGLKNIINSLNEIEIKDRATKVCEYLEKLEGIEGYIYNNYCPNDNCKRMYFTEENGKKCDAIREKIEKWYEKKQINDNEYYFLLSTLLESIDKYANTASVYGAYLKNYKKSALKKFILKDVPLYINDNEHEVYNKDCNELIKEIKMDILYLDPPYNTRQYATNYHLLETIAKNDKPNIKGKTGLRNYEKQKSKYCSKQTVKKEFEDLILNANTKYIFLSYNNEGLLSLEDIKNIMSKRGKYGVFEQKYNRFKADSNREYKDNKTIEYLHYVVVN